MRTALIAGCALAISCANMQTEQQAHDAQGYDNSTQYVTDETLEDMLESAHMLVTEKTYAGPEQIKVTNYSTAVLAEAKDGKQYFATCAHAIHSPERIIDAIGQTYTLQDARIYILVDEEKKELNVFSRNDETDVAILCSNEDLGLRRKIPLADMPLQPGDAVYAAGYPYSLGKFLSTGIITNIGEQSFFYESAPLNPGNSGGPIYVLKQGTPYIAGIGQFYRRGAQGIFGAVHYRHIAEQLEALEAE